MDWNGLKYFLALAEHKTLSDAAVALSASDATVMRRIQQLEQETNTVLFSRGRRGHELTAQGKRMVSIATELHTLATRLEHDYAENERDLTGTVVLATTEYAANYILAPELKTFTSQHPNLRLTLDLSHSHIDLSSTEPTIALRFERPERGSYIVSKIGEVVWGFYVERNLAASLELAPGDLPNGNEPIIGWSPPVDNILVARSLLREFPRSTNVIDTPSLGGQLLLAQAGLGIAHLPCAIGDKTENLIKLASHHEAVRLPAWLVQNKQYKHLKRVQAVTTFIKSVFQNT